MQTALQDEIRLFPHTEISRATYDFMLWLLTSLTNSAAPAETKTAHLKQTTMPHDKTGILLKQGQRVLLPCILVALGPDGRDCNATIRSVDSHANGYTPEVACNASLLLADVPRPAYVEGLPAFEHAEGTPEHAAEERIREDKALRTNLATFVDHLRKSPIKSAERTLALRALQQARHWLGEDLAESGAPKAYPTGNDVTTTKVDPPADVAPPAIDEPAEPAS